MSTIREIPHEDYGEIAAADDITPSRVPIEGHVQITGRVPTHAMPADFGTVRSVVFAGTEDKIELLPYDAHRTEARILITGAAATTTTIQNRGVFSGVGAGADWLVTVPAGHTWALQTIQASLTTSATVATRQVELIIDDGTNELWRLDVPVTQAASLTYEYVFGGYTNDAAVRTVGSNNEVLSELPVLSLGPGFRISTLTTGIQAGDQWSSTIIAFLDTTSTTAAQVYMGSEAQCAQVRSVLPNGPSNILTAGVFSPSTTPVIWRNKDSLWCIPDQTHTATVTVIQERNQA